MPPDEFSWPRDPLGGRRPRVAEAARLVERADPSRAHPDDADEVALLLAERAAEARGTVAAAAPVRIPASRFHDFLRDPDAVLAALRRPMPERPFRATRRGTQFHSWVERLFSPTGYADTLDVAAELLVDASPDDVGAQEGPALRALQERFLSTDWAARTPIEIECEIDLPFDGRVVICRIDAVFPGRDDPSRIEIVDWKTGRVPTGPELELKQLQLALYRAAYAAGRGIDPTLIDASFYYVEHDREIRATDLPDPDELRRRWRAAFAPEGF